MKQLTIVIPCRRPETCMDRISDYIRGADERLEILVVQGDPAADVKTVPGIRIITAENGNFGEAVKVGIEAAEGRYFMILCEEDKLRTENMTRFLDQLEKGNPEVFIFGYTVNDQNGEILRSYAPISDSSGRSIDIIKLYDNYKDISICLNYWSVCYATEFLRKLSLPLQSIDSGGMPEYSILPFIHAESFEIFPAILSELCLRDLESMGDPSGDQSWFLERERETENAVDYYVSKKPLGQARDGFLMKQFSTAINTCYGFFLIHDQNKEEGRKIAGRLRDFLNEKEPRLVRMTDRKYRMYLRMGRFRKGSWMYLKILFPKPNLSAGRGSV